MGKLVLAVLLAGAVVGPVQAANYTRQGRVIAEGYEGPGLTRADLPYAVATGAGLGLFLAVSEPAAVALFPASVIVWGAVRTARYRPEATKALIRHNLAKQRQAAGSVWSIVAP